MPDHLHLFAGFGPPAPPLSHWVKALRGDLSGVLRQQGDERSHWQKGFFDHHMRSEESIRQKYDYVRYNPVRAGLVAKPEDWPYQGEIHPLRV